MVSRRTHLMAQQVALQRAQMGLQPRATGLSKHERRQLARMELLAHRNFSHAMIVGRLELLRDQARIVDQECAKICAANGAACEPGCHSKPRPSSLAGPSLGIKAAGETTR